jgi:hypothetical protein
MAGIYQTVFTDIELCGTTQRKKGLSTKAQSTINF